MTNGYNKPVPNNPALWYTVANEGSQYNFRPNPEAVLDTDVARTFIHAASVNPNQPMPAGDYLPLPNITGLYYLPTNGTKYDGSNRPPKILAGVRVDQSRLDGLVRVLGEKGWKQQDGNTSPINGTTVNRETRLI